MLKLPSPPEVVVLSFPVLLSVTVIAAPGMTPSGPETVPTSVPVLDCANAETAQMQPSNIARVNRFIYVLLKNLVVARSENQYTEILAPVHPILRAGIRQ